MLASSRKEVAKSIKTLVVMLQSMRDQQVTITLRNDTSVTGTIVSVDSDMNIELKEALVERDLFYDTTSKAQVTDSGSPDDQRSSEHTKKEARNFQAPAREHLVISEDSKEGYHDDEGDMQASGSKSPSSSSSDDDDANDSQTAPDEQILDFLVIKGSRIRHIEVPKKLDLLASTKKEIERIRGRRKNWTKRDIVRPGEMDRNEMID